MSEKVNRIKRLFIEHFFDFLMLFLAVALGFVVDNWRDEYNAAKTTKEVAFELVMDISKDSGRIDELVLHCRKKMYKLDSLYEIIDDKPGYKNDSLLYLFSAYVSLRPWFERYGGTFQMITNTGLLDNFTKIAASELAKYQIDCTKLISLLEQERNLLTNKIYPFQQQVFHTENFHSLVDEHKLLVKPELRNWTEEKRWLYHNYITELKIMNHHVYTQYLLLQERARSVIRLLKKEYAI
ncbi:MAG: hypothetical protein RLZZ28_335 [Bacteroidota bacterium]|jgi:hypothetical protein